MPSSMPPYYCAHSCLSLPSFPAKGSHTTSEFLAACAGRAAPHTQRSYRIFIPSDRMSSQVRKPYIEKKRSPATATAGVAIVRAMSGEKTAKNCRQKEMVDSTEKKQGFYPYHRYAHEFPLPFLSHSILTPIPNSISAFPKKHYLKLPLWQRTEE